MKKVILLLSWMLCLALTSCSSEESAPTPQESTVDETSVLLCELQAYNDSMLATKDHTSRGFWNSFFKAVSIAGADACGAYEGSKVGGAIGSLAGPQGAAIGAVLGGAICGAGASYTAYCTTRSLAVILAPERVASAYVDVCDSNVCWADYYPEAISLQLPSEHTDLLDVGAKHNLILGKLLTTASTGLKPLESLSTIEVDILASQDFSDGYYATMLQYNSTDNTSFLINDGTKAYKVMLKYIDMLNKFPEGFSDFEKISNQYLQLVSNTTELTETEKSYIYGAICVAVSSVEYWFQNL